MEGGREEEGFCEGKSGESVRCLLNITKYGLYPTSILAPPWGLVPFLLPFLLSLLFLVIDLYFCTIIFFLCFFLLFYRICYILQISSSSSILDPPLSHWVPTSELPLDKDQNLLHIPLHPCHRIG